MRHLRPPALLLLAGLAACATESNAPALPPIAATGQDPAIAAIYGAMPVFRDTRIVAGRPAEAAIAAIRLEWLAAAMPHDLAFTHSNPITIPAMLAARDNLRAALGIQPGAPGTVVMAGLADAAAALARGDEEAARRALPPPVFAPDTLRRLARLPDLPEANLALLRASKDLDSGPGS